MKKFLKNNLKVFVTLIISAILFTGIGVYAASQYFAKDITFTPTNENFKKENGEPIDNVEDALNELYEKSNSGKYVTEGLVYGYDGTLNYKINTVNVTLDNKMSYFNGTSSYVSLPRYQPSAVSYEAYISSSKTSGTIISSTQGGGYQLYMFDTGAIFNAYINGSYVGTKANFELNKMVHIVATYDGSNIKIYIDGNLISTTPVSGTFGANVNNTVTMIGAEPNGTSAVEPFFKGYIKTVRIYNRALTAEEVKNNYNYEKRN